MGYLKISNLYSNRIMLIFKECYALEKIHGTSAHIKFSYKTEDPNKFLEEPKVNFFSGGEKHDRFVSLFDQKTLLEKFKAIGIPREKDVVVYGEAYGGKQQGMSKTYGPDLKFIVFDVKIDELWLDVPKAEKVSKDLGLEFVFFQKISTDITELDKARDMDSIQAVRNGMGPGHLQEGVILRPLIELRQNNGERLIAKHKRREFMETASERSVVNEDDFRKKLEKDALIDEWTTMNRLKNALSHFAPEDIKIENTAKIIQYMINDIFVESNGEVIDTQEHRKLISRKTALLFKTYLESQILAG